MISYMKKYITKPLALLTLGMGLSSCGILETPKVEDPNNPSLASVINNPTPSQVNQLGVGLQSAMRNGLVDFYRNTGTVGREIIYSASTDNRYYKELLGTESASFNGANDPNGIFNSYYTDYSATRRRAEIFIRSAQTSNTLSAEQKAGVLGFARTVQGYAMLNLLNMQYDNGIREGFSDLFTPGDLLKPGKFGSYASGLALIKAQLDEGAAALDQPGASFPFTVTEGWAKFSGTAGMKKFNRAVAARVAMYQKDWAGMQQALSASFFSLSDTLATGPVFTFSTTAGDQVNGFYQAPDRDENGAPYVVFNEHIRDAEPGDTRVFGDKAKMRKRTLPRASGQDISSDYQVRMYASNTSSVSIIRNEELILMWAEARIQQGALEDGVMALDRIRTAFGLKSLADAKPAILNNKDALIDEVLNQRRYSLFFEGHRWFDARRYNKISTLPLQTGNYVVFQKFNRPDAEVQWDLKNP
jgi:hypothetical protein